MHSHKLILAFFLLAGLLLRLAALNDPVTYDEAYTYIGFASHGPWAAISDYSLPNNHVLHTLLVWASTSLLGNQPVTLRLPALLAGLAMIPAAYLLAKSCYSRESGLVAAALVAWFPQLVRFSTDARGYSLVALFTLLVFWLGWRVLHQPTWRDWALLALCTALGLWTIPLMLYPAGALYLWLALEGPKTRPFFTRWLLSGLGAGLLTVMLYLPVLRVSGWRRLLANGFVQPVPAAKYFDWVLVTRLKETWSTWIGDVPLALTLLLTLGFVLALIFHRRIQTTRWPLSLVLLVWIAALVLTRRPEAFDRFWSWLIAPLLVWAAAGLVETAKRIRVGKLQVNAVLTGLALVGVIAQLTVTVPQIPQNWQKLGNPEAAARYLAENLAPGDMILAGYPNNAPIWYYLNRLGIAETAWQSHAGAPRYWLVLAANQKDQTLESIVKDHKLDPAQVDWQNAALVAEYGKLKIYVTP